MPRTALALGILSILAAMVAGAIQLDEVFALLLRRERMLDYGATLDLALWIALAGLALGVAGIALSWRRWSAAAIVGVVVNLALVGVYAALIAVT